MICTSFKDINVGDARKHPLLRIHTKAEYIIDEIGAIVKRFFKYFLFII